MKKFTYLLTAGFLSFSICMPMTGHAASKETVNQKEAFSFLKKTFNAQVSLTEKERSKAEMEQILSQYMTPKLVKQYMKANAVKGEKEWIVYGTDYPVLTVPFFDYNNRTKVEENKDSVLVYQHFNSENKAAVNSDDHYESVKLVKINGKWKADSIEDYTKQLRD
ncbi:DUF3993 domain-containing protein [Metabacillus sp. RGM 3146]|uniref:DUF3993 domain-containing protein n=1 Tax=Metabacillus sp. RGM 3146 TaxID=3401092 RepID=UPI003B99F64B